MKLEVHRLQHEGTPPGTQTEFRGRLVAPDYPDRHAEAQERTTYDDFTDGVSRERIRYGNPEDRYPGGITYATREERIAYRIKTRKDALDTLLVRAGEGEISKERYLEERARIDLWYPHRDDPNDLVPPDEVIRTDHHCPDCDVEVGELHLSGCNVEICPKCDTQAISCNCQI